MCAACGVNCVCNVLAILHVTHIACVVHCVYCVMLCGSRRSEVGRVRGWMYVMVTDESSERISYVCLYLGVMCLCRVSRSCALLPIYVVYIYYSHVCVPWLCVCRGCVCAVAVCVTIYGIVRI